MDTRWLRFALIAALLPVLSMLFASATTHILAQSRAGMSSATSSSSQLNQAPAANPAAPDQDLPSPYVSFASQSFNSDTTILLFEIAAALAAIGILFASGLAGKIWHMIRRQ
ncbi:MAG TPA: hypothetical protein VNG29_00265 [Candidatus Paceibacterota bacterium]|nr:hypothetical protein [Candidatus Paceibacterota bacterium]